MRGRRRCRIGLAGRAVLFTAVTLLASCASVDDSSLSSSEAPTATAVPEATSTPEPAPKATPEPKAMATAEPVATVVAEPTPTAESGADPDETPSPEPQVDCVVLTDFMSDESNARWLVVNDNVMGGRSLGGRAFGDGTMVFAGAINTDGGGFASLRLPLPADVLSSANRVVLTARSDGRSYLLTLDDRLEGRNPGIQFRAPLEFTAAGEWQTLSVNFVDFSAAIFGEPIATDPLRPELARQIGFMQSDGIDGEFAMEIERIEACA